MKRETFGSRLAVILAMAGSAIGLGNLWRFPYMLGEHGGAFFVIVYIVATLVLGLPVFVAEVLVGRRSRCSAIGAMGKLSGGRKFWNAVGFLTVLTPLIIASYYSVIGGWSLDFLVKSLSSTFVKMGPEAVTGLFTQQVTAPWTPVIYHVVFMAICMLVLVLGVRAGIEKFSKLTIPMLFILIVVIAIYSLTLPGSGAGVRYLVEPSASDFSPKTLAYALGQCFYSMSLGMGVIITYGSYISSKENIMASSVGTAVSDMLFAMLAAFAIMPAVFAAGLEPGAGPGLIFQSVPYIFAKMGETMPIVSSVVAVLFFLAVVVAAMTSCISILEVGVAYLNEKHGISRRRACLYIFLICGSVGVLNSLSFGPLSHVTVAGKTLFDLFDWFSSNILLLLLAFIVVVFVGFVMKREDVLDELSNHGVLKSHARVHKLIYFLIKWVAPIAVLAIFISNFIL